MDKNSIPDIEEMKNAAETALNGKASEADGGALGPGLADAAYSTSELHEDEAVLNFALSQEMDLESTEDKSEGSEVKANPIQNVKKEIHKDDTAKSGRVLRAFLVVILFLILMTLSFNLGRQSVKVIPPTDAAPTPIPTVSVAPAPKTEFVINDLLNFVNGLGEDVTGDFRPSVEELYGFQYLCLTNGNIKLYYKNEHYIGQYEPGRIIIDNGKYRSELEFDYDLTGDISALVPHIGDYGGDGATELVFTAFDNGVPDKLTFINGEKLFCYGTVDIRESLRMLYRVRFSEDPSLEETGKRYQMNFTFSSTSYIYAVSKDTFFTGEYDGLDVIDFIDLSVEYDNDSIVFAANVRSGEDEYLGRVNGSFSRSNLSYSLSGVRFGSFAIPSEAGFGEDDLITPRTSAFKDYVTIIAKSGQRFLLSISDEISPIDIDWENIVINDDGTFEYVVDGKVRSIMGIDVSHYQGDIEWNKVAAAGVKFAILRLGYRGYGEGTLEMDRKFENNIKGALENGIKVGVYFFSEAITPEEAVQEAEFVISKIKAYDVTYPVVFDTEDISGVDARANNLTYEKRTEIARAFCDTIKDAGYHPMIYANSRFMLTAIDLTKLNDIDRWFAYYGTTSQFPYSFSIFQYSETGKIDGISTDVDLDISFVDYSALEK